MAGAAADCAPDTPRLETERLLGSGDDDSGSGSGSPGTVDEDAVAATDARHQGSGGVDGGRRHQRPDQPPRSRFAVSPAANGTIFSATAVRAAVQSQWRAVVAAAALLLVIAALLMPSPLPHSRSGGLASLEFNFGEALNLESMYAQLVNGCGDDCFAATEEERHQQPAAPPGVRGASHGGGGQSGGGTDGNAGAKKSNAGGNDGKGGTSSGTGDDGTGGGGGGVSLAVSTNQSPYHIGSTLLGQAGLLQPEDVEAARAAVMSSQAFKGTLLEQYFRQQQHEQPSAAAGAGPAGPAAPAAGGVVGVDFHLVAQLCREKWATYAPKEELVVHLRDGDNDVARAQQTVLQCARHFARVGSQVSGLHKVPLRLVAVQFYGDGARATPDRVARGNRAASSVVAGLSSQGFDVRVQSSADSDVDFCTLAQAKDTCLSKGAFDSAVNAARVAWGLHTSQPNFEDVKGFRFQDHLPAEHDHKPGDTDRHDWRLSDVYLFGEAVLGVNERWKELRRAITRDGPFEDTLLRRYFLHKKPNTWVDGPLLAELCSGSWAAVAPPEDIVVHQRVGGDDAELVNCATGFWRLLARERKRGPRGSRNRSVTARIVTTQFDAYVNSQVAVLKANLEALGFSVVVQSTVGLLSVAADMKHGIATLDWGMRHHNDSSASRSGGSGRGADASGGGGGGGGVGEGGGDNVQLLQSLLDVIREGAPSLPASGTRANLTVAAAAAATDAFEAIAAAAADADFCTLMQAKRVCHADGNFDKILRVARKQVADAAGRRRQLRQRQQHHRHDQHQH